MPHGVLTLESLLIRRRKADDCLFCRYLQERERLQTREGRLELCQSAQAPVRRYLSLLGIHPEVDAQDLSEDDEALGMILALIQQSVWLSQ